MVMVGVEVVMMGWVADIRPASVAPTNSGHLAKGPQRAGRPRLVNGATTVPRPIVRVRAPDEGCK